MAKLAEELKEVRGINADYAAFSGAGEPTLANKLRQGIERPRVGLVFGDIITDIKLFRNGFESKLCLQMMFIKANGFHQERLS